MLGRDVDLILKQVAALDGFVAKQMEPRLPPRVARTSYAQYGRAAIEELHRIWTSQGGGENNSPSSMQAVQVS